MDVDAMFDRAHAAWRADDWEAAERGYRALLALRPYEANHNLGVLYGAMNRFGEAEAALRRALAGNPTAAVTQHSLSMLLLGGGAWDEGWRLYEARRGVPGLRTPKPPVSYPEWQGEDVAGMRLLVVFEQGLGDLIMFARFIPELERRGASVVFLSDAALTPLLSANGIEMLSAGKGVAWPDADRWVLIGSIPLRLGLTVEGLSGAPYLKAEPRVRGGIGVKARGSPTLASDRHRSMPPAAAARLEALGTSLEPHVAGDFLQTARLIAGLDLVITVDTSMAHLAGALGTPVWVLLGAAYTDWRWLRGRSDSPWYDSARLYRQAAPGDWAGVLDRVQADLR